MILYCVIIYLFWKFVFDVVEYLFYLFIRHNLHTPGGVGMILDEEIQTWKDQIKNTACQTSPALRMLYILGVQQYF